MQKNPSVNFLQKEVKYLGHIICHEGIRMDPEKVRAILEWPHPTNLEELQIFLGLSGFYRKFIQNYAKIAVPMTDQLKGKGSTFTWDEPQRTSIEKLKVAIATAPVLKVADPNEPFVVETYASNFAIGAVLI